MKNQTLQTLAVIKKRIDNNRNNTTISEILEDNKSEIEFLVNKFKLKDEEVLFLAASCICSIDRNEEFDVDDLSRTLDVDKLEILLYQKNLNSLVEKDFLIGFPKECNKRHYRNNTKSAIEILNQDFALHSSVGEHLS